MYLSYISAVHFALYSLQYSHVRDTLESLFSPFFFQFISYHKAENVENKAGYFETWRALANMQRQGTFLYDHMRVMADTLQMTEKDVCICLSLPFAYYE